MSFKENFEKTYRKMLGLGFVIFFSIAATFGLLTLGLALILPTFLFFKLLTIEFSSQLVQAISFALSIPFLYFLFGVSLVFIAPLINKILRLNKFIQGFSGNMYSVETIAWFFHNELVYLTKLFFLNLITPSPLTTLFYKMMGMKVGKNVIINSTNIYDPCLIEIEDNVLIGGSAFLLGHYGQKGRLVMAKLVIKKGTTVGLSATVFGNNTIPEKCLIGPHAVVLPKSKLEPNQKIR